MTSSANTEEVKIKTALISVSDKSGIVELAKSLASLGVKILSTGGTCSLLQRESVPVQEISEYTQFPEMMDGRVKTLHPKVHGGILGRRGLDEHDEHADAENEPGPAPVDGIDGQVGHFSHP